MIWRYGPQAPQPGWTAARSGAGWYIRTVDADGPAAGVLAPGDRVLAIDGDARYAEVDPALKLNFLAPQQWYSMQVAGAGAPRLVRLQSRVTRNRTNAAFYLSLLISGLVFFVAGMALGLVLPGSALTRLGSVASLAFALHVGGLILWPFAAIVPPGQRALCTAAGCVPPWHMVLGYLFFSGFPRAVSEGPAWRATKLLIFVYGTLLFLPRTILKFVALQDEESAIHYHLSHHAWIAPYQAHGIALSSAFKLVVAAAACLVLRRNYRMLAESPDLRRRVKWVTLAAAATIFLPGAFTLATAATGNWLLPKSGSYSADIIVTNLFSTLMPVTLAYAVIKDRVLGIDVAMRRGVQYVFARNSLRLLLLVPLLAIAWNIATHTNRTVAELVTGGSLSSYGFVLLTAGLSLQYRRRLTLWLDRRFFRDVLAEEVILLQLSEHLKTADSAPEILSMVGTQVGAALHPRSIYVSCCNRGLGTPEPAEYSHGEIGEIPGRYKEELRKLADESRSILEIAAESRQLPPCLSGAFEKLGLRLLIPVRDSERRTVGVIVLGEKRSEEPYTASNLNLLRAIAADMGFALELVWLRERVDSERRMRNGALALLDRTGLNLVRECERCGACYDETAQRCAADGTPLTSMLMVERVIHGKYRLDQRIGKGGYGAVYEAWDLGLRRSVAVKVVTGGLLTHPSAMRRFEREAQAVARLRHPNIIAVYDYGPARPDGAYLAMELIRGVTWRSELRRLGVFSPPLTAARFDRLLDGVAAAHREGVIHRDLKPENILIVPETDGPGSIKILDFGLAKVRLVDGNDAESLTVAGTVVGTLGYISPEQFTGEQIDERSDIFSLGIIAVEALTGRRPFRGRTAGEILRSLLNDPIEIQADGRDGHQIKRVLRRCLARDPAGRYRSVNEMRAELIPLLRNCRPLAVRLDRRETIDTMTISG
ncbi:MAG TPA: protein kinase [Bryobacteraceae bacterium]|nr:protein kinase [Bryobacteraceae bacterium]